MSSGIKFTKPGMQDTGDIFPSGIVVLWPSTSSVPTGWAKCNGTSGTVDLRGYYPRGTPSGDIINRTYGAATHTHSATHDHTTQDCSQTHSIAQHCHTLSDHRHDGCKHNHTIDHAHDLCAHTHCGCAHTHGAGTYCSVCFSHSVSTECAVVCASGVDAIVSIDTHECASIIGDSASDGAGATSAADPDTTSDSDTANSGDGGDGTSSSPSIDNTDTAGPTVTGADTIKIDVDSCALTTGVGSTLPTTRNVEYIMKL